MKDNATKSKALLDWTKLIIFMVVIETLLIALFVCSIHQHLEVNEEDTTKIVLDGNSCSIGRYDPVSLRVNVLTDDAVYHITWHGRFARKHHMNVDELVEKLQLDKNLCMNVLSNNAICAIQGTDTEYLSIKEYNAWRKTNSTIAEIILTLIQIMLVVVFFIWGRIISTLHYHGI